MILKNTLAISLGDVGVAGATNEGRLIVSRRIFCYSYKMELYGGA